MQGVFDDLAGPHASGCAPGLAGQRSPSRVRRETSRILRKANVPHCIGSSLLSYSKSRYLTASRLDQLRIRIQTISTRKRFGLTHAFICDLNEAASDQSTRPVDDWSASMDNTHATVDVYRRRVPMASSTPSARFSPHTFKLCIQFHDYATRQTRYENENEESNVLRPSGSQRPIVRLARITTCSLLCKHAIEFNDCCSLAALLWFCRSPRR